jgi:uncharacterized protein (TIGR02453 family)
VTSFNGFSDQGLELYVGLEADNSKEFWAAHKTVWETEVRDPMAALLDALEDEFGPGKVLRPYRDVRFSKDKTPYKTHQGAFVGGTLGIGYYVQLDARGLLAGGGWRAHEPGQVERYRVAVADDASGPPLVAAMDALRAAGFTVEGDPVKTRPRGYPPDHPRLDLLRNRSLMVVRGFGAPDWLATPGALDQVRDAWRAVTPLAIWVTEHVETH